ncbi:Gaa1-like, GPI transamidase component [Trichuris suis]|nr:Gaa1-like, GPI transamidase component [Trichuris suis]
MEEEQPCCSSSVASARLEHYEYETLHFGFSPKALMDTIYNITFDTAMAEATAIEEELLSEALDEDRKAAVKDRVNLLRAKIEKVLDHSIIQLQNLSLKKLFRIRSYVSLPEDKVQNPPFGPITHTEHLKACEKAKELEKKCSTQRFILNAHKEELELIRNLKEMTVANDRRLHSIIFADPNMHICVTNLAVLIDDKPVRLFNLNNGKVTEDQCVPLNGATRFRLELQLFAKADVAAGLKFIHALSYENDNYLEKHVEQEITGLTESNRTTLTVLPVEYTSAEISIPNGKAPERAVILLKFVHQLSIVTSIECIRQIAVEAPHASTKLYSQAFVLPKIEQVGKGKESLTCSLWVIASRDFDCVRARLIMSCDSKIDGPAKLKAWLIKNGNRLAVTSYLCGLLYYAVIVHPAMRSNTYISESALLVGLVDEEIRSPNVFFGENPKLLELIKKANVRPASAVQWAFARFNELSLETGLQGYAIESSLGRNVSGTTAYGLLRTRRGSSSECVIVSAAADSPFSIAFLFYLAKSFISRPYWAKNILFMVHEHPSLGMMAWLSTYHFGGHPFIHAENIPFQAGRIEVALNIRTDISGAPTHVNIEYNSLNGQLPNLDLVNLAVRTMRKHGLVPTIFMQRPKRAKTEFDDMVFRGKTFLLGLLSQAVSLPADAHTVCGQFGIHALSLSTYSKSKRSSTSNGHHSFAKVVESMLRSVNNLQEILHQSFFFYVLPSVDSYISIGIYAPGIGLLLLVPLLQATKCWLTLTPSDSGLTETQATLKAVSFVPLLVWLCIPFSAAVPLLPYFTHSFGSRWPAYPMSALCASHAAAFILPLMIQGSEWQRTYYYAVLKFVLLLLLTLTIASVSVLNFGLGLAFSCTFVPIVTLMRCSKSVYAFLSQLALLLTVHPLVLVCAMRKVQSLLSISSTFDIVSALDSFLCNVIVDTKECISEMIYSNMLYFDWSYLITVMCLTIWIAALGYILPSYG